MAATIGIKIANGEFYSILEENSSVKKRLILTTVHDKQRSVQIDLYKSYAKTMADAFYIGSLVVENIRAKGKGEPSVQLTISSDQAGNINADAMDMDPAAAKEHQYLNVSLESLDEDNREYEIPDFELEEDHDPPPSGLYEKARNKGKAMAPGSPWILIACALLILAVLFFGLWLFVFRGKAPRNPADPEINTETGSYNAGPGEIGTSPVVQPPSPPLPVAAVSEPPPPRSDSPPPVIQAPAQAPAPVTLRRTRPVPPVASYRVPASIPREGVSYRIRFGDTLWDISQAFYRTPWLYPRIAVFNNIRNPDLIISGTTIRIPPRN